MLYVGNYPINTAGGTVTNIATGVGLTGGPITTTGTIALSTPLQPIATLTGNSLKYLRVNAGETAVEYATVTPGSGTVTDVSVVTANGVSGSVATSTTTPAITLTLGDITPTSVNGVKIRTGNPGAAGDVGVGNFALANNSSGFNYNVAVGVNASLTNTSGAANTAIGMDALYSNSTGSNNVAIGAKAGRYETGSNAFYVDVLDRTNTAGDKAGALLYGTFNATATSQTLKVNAGTFTVIGAGVFGANSGTNGQLTLNGSTSGSGIIKVAAAAGSGIVFQIPSSNGSSGNVLTTDGAGVTSWSAMSAGLTWSIVTADQTMAVNTGYIANKGTLLTMTLPTTASVGSVIEIVGMNAGLWKIAQNASQLIRFGNQATTTGVSGSLSSALAYDTVKIVCSVANTEWIVVSSVGTLTVI